MPTVLFVMKYPLHRADNLKRKFDGQMAAMRRLGYETCCVGYDGREMLLLSENACEPLLRTPLGRMPGYEHTLVFWDLMRAVRAALKRRKLDLLYLRFMPTFGNAPGALRAFKARGGRLIVEYPTYPMDEEKASTAARKLVFGYTDRVMARINPLVDLYTLIGDACDGSLNGRPAMNIVNGVDVQALPLHQPNANEPSIHLLALASMSGWHGYDRVIRALAEDKSGADVRLHMVGGDGDGSLARWRALADELALGDKVIFHGAMHGDALNALIARCDVGIGSLGMYRYGYQTATTLKLREYMARGLPFVTAVYDPTLPDDPDFALHVPNDDTPIDMAEIVRFARKVKAETDLPERMRACANQRMSWDGVLRGVLERLDA